MVEPQGNVNWCMKILNYVLCHPNDPQQPKKTCGRKCVDCLKPAIEEDQEDGSPPKREVWANRCEFFMSALGMSVGLGSVWRFPTLTYQMGGAAFLVVYTVCVLVLGNALFFFEVSNGQYTSKNPLRVYDKVPLFQGVGYSMIMYAYLFCTYYIHMVSFAFYYLAASFNSPLPWTYCPDETKEHKDSVTCMPISNPEYPEVKGIVCGEVAFKYNLTTFCRDEEYSKYRIEKCCKAVGATTEASCREHMDRNKICGNREYPSSYYWSHTVTKSYRKDDPHYGYLGEINGYLVLSLFASWFICYIGLYKGLKSLGLMMYIIVPIPYIILIIMLVAALTQDGATDGLIALFLPNWKSFYDLDVWRRGIEQAFYSVGVSMGPLITFGSYQKFNSPSHIDGLFICICIVLTGILCCLVVFSILGFLAKKTGRPFDKVVEAGPGLVFIVYPESLEILPGSVFFAILFYLMLINLGVSSVTGIIETVSSACYDIWPKTRKYKYIVNLFVTLSSFLIGLLITARGGLTVYYAFDTYAAGLTLIPIGALELFIITYLYGLGRFCEDISFMIGFYPNRYYRYVWMISPILLLAVFIYGLVEFKTPEGWKLWTHLLSWFLFFLVLGSVPITMIVQLIRYGRRKELKQVVKPPPSHGPADPEARQLREQYTVRRKIF